MSAAVKAATSGRAAMRDMEIIGAARVSRGELVDSDMASGVTRASRIHRGGTAGSPSTEAAGLRRLGLDIGNWHLNLPTGHTG